MPEYAIPFLLFFLPCVLLLYFVLPKRFKNAVLVVSSLFFYAWICPKYAVILVAVTVQSYVFGLLIGRFGGKITSRVLCILSVSLSLLPFLFFRCAGAFPAGAEIALPVGMGLYTLRMIGYTADVYRKKAAPQKNVISFFVYAVMFPLVIAGPIVGYAEIEKQLESRTHNIKSAAEGTRRFIIGLAKKAIIAASLLKLVQAYRGSDEKTVLFAWLYAAALALYVYFELSGYSDMAIGLGGIFGFKLPENFARPFASCGLLELTQRWHITLGAWFKSYVYIPLGGNRAGKLRAALNILIVWEAFALWHGFTWSFAVWGAFCAVLFAAESALRGKCPRAAGHVFTPLFVMLSVVFVCAEGTGTAFGSIAAMFGAGGLPLSGTETLYCLKSYAVVLAVSALTVSPLPQKAAELALSKKAGQAVLNTLEPVVLTALLVLSAAFMLS